MTTKSIRLRLPSEVEQKAKDLYKRLYPRHKYDPAILFEELIETAETVKEKFKQLESILASEELAMSPMTNTETNDTV
jgi:uncharacterized protein YhbP (UPF0306 family)